MKIALVSPYDFAHPGGVPNHITWLEYYLTRMGNEVKIIAPASKEVSTFGDRFIPIGKPRPIPSSGSIIRIPVSLHLAPTIKAVLAREKFDIIHLHEPFMPMLCSAVLRFSNTVTVGTFHAADGRPGYNWGRPISTWMIRGRLKHLHGKIAVSEPAMKYHSRYIPGPYEIIPNGVDTRRFSPYVEPLEEYNDGKKKVLFLGRLETRKGLKYLVRAMEQVKREVPDTRLLIVGPGTRLRGKYEKQVSKAGLDGDVKFIGFIPEMDKPKYFKTADVYCSPATGRESQGIVLLESMAVGTPVVASSIAGYASVVTNGEEGLLTPPKDSDSLARAIITLLKDDDLRKRMGEKGRATSANYSWDSVSQRVYDFYEKTINEVKQRAAGGKSN